MKIFTIGFTQKKVKDFFEILKTFSVKRIIDTRLSNSSQLAGFAKKDDLEFFVQQICGNSYDHQLRLAPSQEILDEYKKKTFSWEDYRMKYLNLIESRGVEHIFNHKDLDGACFLCSEALPHHCHRKLLAEYFQMKWGNIEIIHL